MTSQGEGLPMAMIEAMSCGLPAVMSAHADVEDVAVHGENALLVREPSAEAFAAAAGRLLGDPDLYDRLREGALAYRERAREVSSLAHQASLWARQLTSATRGRG